MSDTRSTDIVTPPGRTRLISNPDDLQVMTRDYETDARTAITRGLKEYLEQLVVNWPGGRQSKFAKVFQTWAEPEVPAEYPSAVVYATEPGTYDARNFTPSTEQLADGFVIRLSAEFVQNVVVEVWTTDPKERVALVKMLEDAFSPVDWMYGFRLELPHYHNMRATFEPMTMAYDDSADDAQRRYRRVIMVLTAHVAVVRGAFDADGNMVPPLDIRVEYDITEATPAFDPTAGGVTTAVGKTPDLMRGAQVTQSGPPMGDGGSVVQIGSGQPEPPKVP